MTLDRALIQRWPQHLINRVAARDFVLVVGAGVSRTCNNSAGNAPPTWTTLLEILTRAFTSGRLQASVKQLVAQERFLDAAELLRTQSRKTSKEQDFLQLIADTTDGGSKASELYNPSSLHEVLLRLDPNVIVTTNYDRLLERASKNGFNVHSYDSPDLARDIRVGTPTLVKVHGSVDAPSKLILTRSDYSRLRLTGTKVLEVLQALFLTRTALFVGYSFSDPDIHLLLENVLGARGEVAAHYILTSDTLPSHQREVYNYCYGTAPITYRAGDFSEMRRMLELFTLEVEARR